MDQLEGQLPGSSIHHVNDGFLYLRYQTINNTQYFRCKYWRQGCPSRANVSRDNVFQLTSGHSHAPDINQAVVLRERHVLLDQARNPNFGSIANILNNVRNDHPMEQLERQHLYRAMTRARSQTLPSVHNLADLRMVLEHPSFSWLTAYEERLDHTGYRGSSQAPDGSQVILFLSKKCEHFLLTVTSIFIIQTSTIINNQQYKEISLAWLFFERSNPDTFSVGFSLLKAHSPTYRFSQAFCRRDEVANAFHRVYPMEVKSSIQLAESTSILLQSPAGVKIIKLCCAFLLLPNDLMQIGLNQIVRHAQIAGEEVRIQSVHLFNYIEREWLSSDTLELNLCGNFEGTHYSIIDLGLKLERDLMPANDFYFIIKYIISSITKAHQKISSAVSGSRLRNSGPIPLAAELPFWNLLRATGFPPESKASNILTYVSDMLMI